MNQDLAILIPGLTYTEKWSIDAYQDSYDKRFDTIKRTFDNVKFYIHTWDNEFNDYENLLRELDNHDFAYEIITEKYEDYFDDMISDYIKNLDSSFLELWNICSNYKTNWNEINYLRRHFSIYYKFYKSYEMNNNENWILRIKSNNIFHLNFNETDIETLIKTFDYNENSKNKIANKDLFKRELGPNSIIKSDNTLFCSISDVNINGQIKINENAIFGHKNTWGKKVFGQYTDIDEYLDNILGIYFETFKKDHGENPINDYPHPAVGSMVWSEYFKDKKIMLLSRICNAGPANRSGKRNIWY